MIRLRALRRTAGIATQEQLAALCRLRQQHISALESGKIATPTLRTARKLVAGLNQRLPRPITIDDLLTPEEPCPPCLTT
jgi:transcriptional regulator with XRE-family HTH domain